MRAHRIVPLVLACLTLALPATALAAPGDLDLSYGVGGRAELGLNGTTYVNGMAVDPQGRTILVGENEAAGYVVRLLPDGHRDPTFDGTGAELLPKGTILWSVAVQADGKVVAVGAHGVSSKDFGDLDVYRFEADGSPDPSFGSGGHVTTSLPGQQEGRSVAIEPSGKIVVGGFSWPVGSDDGAIWRLLPDGQFDPSFSGDGMQSLHTGGMILGVAVALAPEGKLVLAGQSVDSQRGVVFRVDADGSPDTTFGPGGARLTAPGPNDRFEAVAVRPSGAVLAAGSSTESAGTDPIVQQFAADGSADGSFAGTGRIKIPIGAGAFTGAAVLQPDGKLVVVGRSSDEKQVFALRVLPDGSLDPTFGAAGLVLVPTKGVDEVRGCALQPDGDIVLAGIADYEGFTERLIGGPFPAPPIEPPVESTAAPAGPPPGTPQGRPPGPVISKVFLSPARFAVARSTAAVSLRTRRGTRIHFSASSGGTVDIAVEKIVVRHRHRRLVPVGTVDARLAVKAGSQVRKFSGRLGGRPLPPGRYRLTLAETDGRAVGSAPRSASFTVLPRR